MIRRAMPEIRQMHFDGNNDFLHVKQDKLTGQDTIQTITNVIQTRFVRNDVSIFSKLPVLNTNLADSYFKFERKGDSRINKEDATAFGSYRKMHRSRPLPPRLDYRVPCPSIHC